ncbi:MAG TPA: hypothetical protein VKP67_17850 [Xanthobacteraceae bacterium]|nr:hypothetical protein [Xanthobacteraceae bacterium]
MTTNEELCLLENYARYSYTGQGQIVDLGCWLGATTLCLARGLADNAQHRHLRAIDAIDRFVWEDWMTPIAAALGVTKAYRAGDDYLAEVEALLSGYEQMVRLRREDLSRRQSFRPRVEFLLIDAMKSWDLANAISRTFFPRLIPGRSLVVQQDFGYHAAIVATNHLLMWQLREHFECINCVPRSCSAVYFHTKAIARRDLPVLSPDSVTLDMIDQAWEHSLSVADSAMRPAVLMCKLLFLIERGAPEAAVAAAERLNAESQPVSNAALIDAQRMIADSSAFAWQDRAAAQTWNRLGDIIGTLAVRTGY